MEIKYAICGLVLFAASFLVVKRLHSEDEAAATGQQATSAVIMQSEIDAGTKIFMPYCYMASSSDPNGMSEKDLLNYILTCTARLLEAKEYKSLDAMIIYLRDKKVRTPSGLWLQSSFYTGIGRFIGKAKSEAEFDAIDAQFSEWLAASKNSEAAHLALSRSMIRRAWFYRGSGYASTVSEEAFEKFRKQISKTKKFMLEHESVSGRDPEWYSQWFSVLLAENGADEEGYKRYFDNAVKQYPEYYPMYFSAATFYLSKWHGDDEAFDKFARSADGILEPGQASALYSRIYWSHACSRCGDDVENWRDHWDDISAGFEQIISDYPDPWNINNYARIACSAYDQDKTLELMKKIGSTPLSEAWDDEQFSYQYCANWSGHKLEAK
ncbi:MAG: hypothetical protein ACREPB_02025 [Arenimonas sp.]